MRRSTSALTAALAAIGLSTPFAGAQQPSAASARSASADDAGSTMSDRPARYLLRNGMDYLAYREYGRALTFLRVVEGRQKELNEAERASLKKAIARAQEGLREPVNATQQASAKGRPKVQAGAFALAQAAPAAPKIAAEPVQLTAATVEESPTASPIETASAPTEPAAPVFGAAPSALPSLPSATPLAMGDGAPMVALPAEAPAPLPVAAPTVAATDPVALPAADPASLPSLPAAEPAGLSGLPPLTAADITATPPSLEASPVPEVASVTAPTFDPAATPTLAPAPVEPVVVPMPETPPGVATPVALAPIDPVPTPPAFPVGRPLPAIEPSPVAEADSLPALPADSTTATEPRRSTRASGNLGLPSILSPKLQEEVDRIAQRQPADDKQLFDRPQMGTAGDPGAPMQAMQGSTRLELPRAPSPTEARPLRRIPVPEEFETLPPRSWNPNRKLWAAGATCHMPLYFQDAVLERYGQSAEQALGPNGRFFSYPLDDPRQSNQRNQILQPFASIGLFCFQIGTLPYKMFVDPPWEAEYDLGYYRPGDRIPTDTIYATPTGLGPPGHGRKY